MPILANPRHELFAQELAKGKSADEAYVIAGYSANRGNAARMNANESVQKRVEEIMQRGAERAEITVSKVLTELAKIGFSDIRKAVEWRSRLEVKAQDADGMPVALNVNDVALVNSEDLDDETAAAIAEVSQGKDGGLKIKLHDKRAALVDIGKHLGMFVERSENVNINHDVSDQPLSEDEWEAQHARPN